MAGERKAAQTPKQAEREAADVAREAQDRLAEAAEAAAAAGQGLAAARMQNVPPMKVEVMPGCTVSHNGETYYGDGYTLAPEGHKGNDELELEGPTALALMQQGLVQIKGAA